MSVSYINKDRCLINQNSFTKWLRNYCRNDEFKTWRVKWDIKSVKFILTKRRISISLEKKYSGNSIKFE